MAAEGVTFILDTLLKATNLAEKSPSTNWHGHDYQTVDDMLNTRKQEYKRFLREFAEKYHTDNGVILDVACGSGLDSAVFLEHGYSVVSMDLCKDMVSLCKRNKQFLVDNGGEKFEPWDIMRGDMTKITESLSSTGLDVPKTYDSLVCLGNSIPFLMYEEDLMAFFQGVHESLRPGGAALIDSRNYLPVLEKGIINQRGRNPKINDRYNGVADVLPHIIRAPGSDGKNITATVLQYVNYDGSSTYITLNPLTPDRVKSLARSVFGEKCNIRVFYDLQEVASPPADACWVDYLIEKSL